ncbi:hypothetical protein B5F29_11180 [Lachnoclostridium sp. An196]|nr:hypothetical protein B5F29_11180 [Lachnoclostridium sp. An196]
MEKGLGSGRKSKLCIDSHVSGERGEKLRVSSPGFFHIESSLEDIMIETKQLQYLVVCADLKSFSRAAEVLYTTQPNVSKVIRSLEEELGFPIFARETRGIRLTARGEQVYEYACRVMDNMEEMMSLSRTDSAEELHVSFNPSSWISACFADFYNANQQENVCFHVVTASTEEVIRRCARGIDELGFVYVMEDQMPFFEYQLERGHLAFTELKRVRAMLYPGDGSGEKEPDSAGQDLRRPVRLVQCYEDEFSLDRSWGMTGGKDGRNNIQVAVITNSDYVMNDLLCRTGLGNISGDYLDAGEEPGRRQGISLSGEDRPVCFGYIRKDGEIPGKWADKFLRFIQEHI